MKKLIFLAFVAVFLLTACSGNNEETSAPPAGATEPTNAAADAASNQEDDRPSGIEVDKGLLNVEITLPASFLGSDDVEQAIEEAKAKGVSEAKINEDGSVTYKMSKATHEKMLKEMKETAVESINELISDDTFTSIKDIKYNDKLSEFTVIVDREAYENSFDGIALLGLSFQGMFYQTFEGVPSDKLSVTVNVKDEKTGEIFHTSVFPDKGQ